MLLAIDCEAAFTITLLAECSPIQANWDAAVPGAHC